LKRTTRNERTTGPALRHEIGLTLFGVSVERPSKWRKPIIYVTFALQIGRPSHTITDIAAWGMEGQSCLSVCLLKCAMRRHMDGGRFMKKRKAKEGVA
jgi:hypothetical protein